MLLDPVFVLFVDRLSLLKDSPPLGTDLERVGPPVGRVPSPDHEVPALEFVDESDKVWALYVEHLADLDLGESRARVQER